MEVEVASWDEQKSPEDLRKWITKDLNRPVVFQGRLSSWKVASTWSVEEICQALGGSEKKTEFKVCPKRGSSSFQKHFKENRAIFETQCCYIEATFADLQEWMVDSEILSPSACQTESTNESVKAKTQSFSLDLEEQPQKKLKLESSSEPVTGVHSNPLLQYERAQYWIYSDYKYMSDLCSDRPELLSAIDWGTLGFEGKDGKESTLWIGSEGAYTPCHYDTYGCNLVGQLWGKKRWVLFPPEDSGKLYPTRVPYEESSVFSSVNVVCPDLDAYPEFAEATTYEVKVYVMVVQHGKLFTPNCVKMLSKNMHELTGLFKDTRNCSTSHRMLVHVDSYMYRRML